MSVSLCTNSRQLIKKSKPGLVVPNFMQITFHGVRGSVPVSGPKFSKYGGHTSCLEVCTDDVQLIIDAGSGFQNVKLLEDRPLLLVFSHFHHDHIQGLAFNPDLLRQKREIFLASALCDAKTLQNNLKNYFHGAYFPIDLIEVKDKFVFCDFEKLTQRSSANLKISSMPMNHPGGCAAYKIEIDGTQICTLFDNEFEANQLQQLCDFVSGSELVIWDGMLLDEEMPARRGWGHSSIEEGLRFFEALGDESAELQLAITHHAPARTDSELDHLQSDMLTDGVFIARENQVVDLNPK